MEPEHHEIELVKRNQVTQAAPLLSGAIRGLLAGFAEIVILACTEVELALGDDELLEFCLDSNLALAQACVEWTLAQRR